uniref:Ovule protein n=1 Tax=Haemonchus placei TaxID=6290 RepID=A0A0N4W636_HAEPC
QQKLTLSHSPRSELSTFSSRTGFPLLRRNISQSASVTTFISSRKKNRKLHAFKKKMKRCTFAQVRLPA